MLYYVKNADSNAKLTTLAAKAELKAEQQKMAKLQTLDLRYFLGKIFFDDDSSQNMLLYQPSLDTFELEKGKAMIIFLAGNQRECMLLNLSHFILLSCIA